MISLKTELKLEKKLSPLNVWALALGCIIGWGAFVMPGNTFLGKAGPLGTAIAMGAAALIPAGAGRSAPPAKDVSPEMGRSVRRFPGEKGFRT